MSFCKHFSSGVVFIIGLWSVILPQSNTISQETPGDYKSFSLEFLLELANRQPDEPRIWAELAERYLEKNTVQSRQKAATAIRKAIELRPDHVPYRLLHIRTLHAQGFFDATRREAKNLIKSIPPDALNIHYLAEAYYYSGFTSEREAFRYLNMRSNPAGGDRALLESVDLNLTQYADQYFREAANDYENAIRLNPHHRSACFRLIMLLYEIKAYAAMLQLSETCRNLFPADPHPYLFSALAHYSLGRYRQSAEDYRQALNLMDEHLSEGYFSIAPIVDSDRYNEYQNAKMQYETRVPWIEKFWNAKDPFLSTPYNERQLEHYNRVTYANWRYGVPALRLDGWKTERGKLYIRYGKPDNQYRIQPDERTLGGWEVWIYPHYTFYFRDDYATDHFLLDNRSLLTLSSAYNTAADRYRAPYAIIPVMAKSYQFRSRSGATEIWFYCRYDSAFAGSYRNVNDSLHYYVYLLDSLYRIRFSNQKSGRIHEMQKSDIPLFALSVNAEAEKSKTLPYAVEIRWADEKNISSARGLCTLRDFSKDQLALSDLMICESLPALNKETLIPKADSSLNRNAPVYIYFEVYYLTLNQDGKAQYNITARLSPTRGQSVIKKFSEWLKSGSKSDIATSFAATASSRFDSYALGLDISSFPSGDYQLILTITDLNSGQSASQTLAVYIEE